MIFPRIFKEAPDQELPRPRKHEVHIYSNGTKKNVGQTGWEKEGHCNKLGSS